MFARVWNVLPQQLVKYSKLKTLNHNLGNLNQRFQSNITKKRYFLFKSFFKISLFIH